MSEETCYTVAQLVTVFSAVDFDNQVNAFRKIQTYVLVTVLVLLLQLGFLMKPFAFRFFRYLSWASYLLVPALISYVLGLMGRSGPTYGDLFLLPKSGLTDALRYMTCVWAIFLLFAYAGFDNLNAFSLEERHGRSRLVIQLGIQFALLLFILYQLPSNTNVIPIACVFLVLFFKFVERVVALAHSAGATPRIKREVARIIDHMNSQLHGSADPNPMTMDGFKYLVGPRYSTVTLDKIQGRLLSANAQLKDTCLSFSLFWLLLGKFWSYPLYQQGSRSRSSRAKAWKLVHDGLLAKEGAHERVFRVIEVELTFLRDYFHAKYTFFYLNGFYWKLISVLASPVLFWYFTQKAAVYQLLKGDTLTAVANTIVVSVILALEVLQLVMFLTSRWLEVTLICYYVERKTSNNIFAGLSCWFLENFGPVLLGSSCNQKNTWWRKPWSRRLEQYSLVQSCTSVPKLTTLLRLNLVSVLGLPFPKPGMKRDRCIKLSEQVKEAVVVSLQRNGPRLSNGAASLRHNGVVKELSWACKLERDVDVILVWHIATSFCEMHPTSQEHTAQSTKNMEVATSLSKYCAYLLFFAPSLLHVPALEAETTCDNVIGEARESFKESFFACGKTVDKYEEMKKLIIDLEIGDPSSSILASGAKLGTDLVTLVKEQDKRWKILAEFWAELMLFLTPSNGNEMAHAATLSVGGEFITHLWALLVHAGITDRDDMAAFLQETDEDST